MPLPPQTGAPRRGRPRACQTTVDRVALTELRQRRIVGSQLAFRCGEVPARVSTLARSIEVDIAVTLGPRSDSIWRWRSDLAGPGEVAQHRARLGEGAADERFRLAVPCNLHDQLFTSLAHFRRRQRPEQGDRRVDLRPACGHPGIPGARRVLDDALGRRERLVRRPAVPWTRTRSRQAWARPARSPAPRK